MNKWTHCWSANLAASLKSDILPVNYHFGRVEILFCSKTILKMQVNQIYLQRFKKLWRASISLLRKQRRLQRKLSLDITWAFDLLKIWQISKPFYIISYTKSSWESPQYHVFYFAMYICGQSCIMSFFTQKKSLPINFVPKKRELRQVVPYKAILNTEL